MREIKFRAWDKAEKMFVNPSLIALTGRGFPMCYIDNNWHTRSSDTVDFMQYTGLLDKDGKEIWEGDIVVVHGDWTDEQTYEVQWRGDEGYPAFDLSGWDSESNGLSEATSCPDYEVKIVGNIYENPELLTI